jgi:hypothetical protein
MYEFALPAGCRLKITASMESSSIIRRRWTVAIFAAVDPHEPRAHYGSRIGPGETRRIDAAPLKTASVCQVASQHEVGGEWKGDTDEVVADASTDLAVRFRTRVGGGDRAEHDEACLLSFEFSPARAGVL